MTHITDQMVEAAIDAFEDANAPYKPRGEPNWSPHEQNKFKMRAALEAALSAGGEAPMSEREELIARLRERASRYSVHSIERPLLEEAAAALAAPSPEAAGSAEALGSKELEKARVALAEALAERDHALKHLGADTGYDCNICGQRMFGSMIGNGAVRQGFAHQSCYYRQERDALQSAVDRLLPAVKFADTRAVSQAAYAHACIEDRRLRDLIDVALDRQDEPCVTPEEQRAQGRRCPCRSADDYCTCQNVPDDETLKARKSGA